MITTVGRQGDLFANLERIVRHGINNYQIKFKLLQLANAGCRNAEVILFRIEQEEKKLIAATWELENL